MDKRKEHTGSGGTSSTGVRYSRHYNRNFSNHSKSRSPSPCVGNGNSVKQLVLSSSSASGILLAAPGYEQYQKSLLEVPFHAEYGEASSDDLSSEWDSDVPEPPVTHTKVSVFSFKSAVTRWVDLALFGLVKEHKLFQMKGRVLQRKMKYKNEIVCQFKLNLL